MTFGRHFLVFPGKALEPGFSLCWSALGLVPLISSKGPADLDGKNSVVKMRVFFGSPPEKQAIYGERASAPSKKSVKLQSQLMSAGVLVYGCFGVFWPAPGCFGLLCLVCLGCSGLLWVALVGLFGLLWAALGCFGPLGLLRTAFVIG